MEGNGNGNGETRPALDTVILTYDRVRDHLEVGGACNSIDLMLDMLARATRVTEQRWKLQAMEQFRAQAAEAALAEQVRRGLAQNKR
jgi:predicted DNA-binding protein (UPF0278 family)